MITLLTEPELNHVAGAITPISSLLIAGGIVAVSGALLLGTGYMKTKTRVIAAVSDGFVDGTIFYTTRSYSCGPGGAHWLKSRGTLILIVGATFLAAGGGWWLYDYITN